MAHCNPPCTPQDPSRPESDTLAARALPMTTAEEKARILAGQYPYYPVLPMVRRKTPHTWTLKDIEEGVLIAPQFNIIYLINVCLLALGVVKLTPQTPHITYTDLDAVLADGWHGD